MTLTSRLAAVEAELARTSDQAHRSPSGSPVLFRHVALGMLLPHYRHAVTLAARLDRVRSGSPTDFARIDRCQRLLEDQMRDIEKLEGQWMAVEPVAQNAALSIAAE